MTNSNIITISQLAEEMFMAPKSLRKKLRDNKIEKPGKRWEWPEDHRTVAQIRNWKNEKPSKQKAAKVEVPEVTGVDVPMETIIADIEMEKSMDEELGWGQEPEVEEIQVLQMGAWTITVDPANGVKAEAGKDKTKWMKSPEDIRPSLPKKVKTMISLQMLKTVI